MTAVEAGRSSLIDGWGIHWIPGRGWTYNLWGFGCVVIQQGKKTTRVGTWKSNGSSGHGGVLAWMPCSVVISGVAFMRIPRTAACASPALSPLSPPGERGRG